MATHHKHRPPGVAQMRVLRYCAAHEVATGRFPTRPEIAAQLGWAQRGTGGVTVLLEGLVARGLLGVVEGHDGRVARWYLTDKALPALAEFEAEAGAGGAP